MIRLLFVRSLPLDLSWLVAGVLGFALFLIAGATAYAALIGGVLAGVFGLVGALSAELTRAVRARRQRDEPSHSITRTYCCEAGVREWPDPCPWHPGYRDEPPERG